MEQGNLYIISGPSGAGKSSVLREVFQRMPDAYFSVSATTRKMRPGEVEGEHYHFVSKEQFHQMIEDEKLLEYAEFVGNLYGTPREPITEMTEAGKNVFMDIELQGVRQVKLKMPEAVSVFLVPPSLEVLRDRLISRGTDSAETVNRRIETAVRDCAHAHIFDYIVINDDISKAADEIIAIITAEGCRAERRLDLINGGRFSDDFERENSNAV